MELHSSEINRQQIEQDTNLAMNPFLHGYYETSELRGFGFRSVGEGVRISKSCSIIGLERISIKSNVRIDDATSIVAASGYLDIGSFVHIGGGCHLACAGGITLSDFSGLSQGVRIYSSTDDYSGTALTNPTIPDEYSNVRVAPVFLGRHAIIGSGSVILPGTRLEEGCSVGALSLVTKSLPAWGVYFGSPARRLRSRKKDLLAMEEELLRSAKIESRK